MHLATVRAPAGGHAAVKTDTDLLDLTAAAALLPEATALPSSLRGLLAAGPEALALVRRLRDTVLADAGLAARLRGAGALVPEADAALLAPIPDPVLILSCGRNYRSHMAEMDKSAKAAAAAATKAQPTGFIKNTAAVIGPGEAIRLPRTHPDMVDWEAEFCAVIGRPCHNVPVDKVMDYVAGFTMINDVSARDFIPPPDASGKISMTNDQSEMNLHGKQFPTFCPMGPYLATREEIADPDDVNFTLSVNGEVMQSANSGDVYFNLAALVSFFSTFYRFQPGDVISSGSPAGVGFGRNPRQFLRSGDKVEISCDGVGRFINPVLSEPA